MKYAITWLALTVAIALGIGKLSWLEYRRLAVHGVRTQGLTIEILPMQHGTVRYEYHVDGRKFEGQTQPWPPNPEWMSVGQTVVVYYDPEYPERSVLGDPRPILKNETISIALAALIGPTFIVLVWRFRRQKS
jgi:hypothetical protein